MVESRVESLVYLTADNLVCMLGSRLDRKKAVLLEKLTVDYLVV